MANNEYVNKVQFGNTTIMDISDTTAESNDVIEGEVFYTKSGARSTGTLGDATQSTHGLMSTTDKIKLDGIDTMLGATSTTVGATGLVPTPTTADVNKFLAGDGTWKDGGMPMVILSYGNSTWQDFINAYNNHVIVYCRASSNSNPASGSQTRMAFMAYVNDATNPTNVEFQYYRSMSSHSATAMGDEVYVYKLTNANGGTWSVTIRKASIKEIAVASGSKLGVSWSSDKVTLSNTMTADDMPMSSSDSTTAKAAIEAKYTKPSGGIPSTDLAETYLTSHQDISGKANSADLATVAVTGDYDDLINKPTIPTIPTNVSTFTNDAGYLTSHQDISGKANSADLATVATSGSYTDLNNTPTIPTNVSDLTNDSGYLTSVPTATTYEAGLLSAADKAKLDGISGNVYTEYNITIATTDWTLDNNTYTYTYINAAITSSCLVDVIFITEPSSVLTAALDADKVSGGYQFITDTLPSGPLSLKLRIIDSDTTMVNKIVNNLTTTDAGYILDARQGKALQDQIGTVPSGKTVESQISGLSDQINNIEAVTVTPHATNISSGTITCFKIGKLCFVAFSSVVFGTTGTSLELVTGLPKKVGGGTAAAFLTSNSPSATASSLNAGNCIFIGNNSTILNGHIGLAGTTKFWGWLIYPWG